VASVCFIFVDCGPDANASGSRVRRPKCDVRMHICGAYWSEFVPTFLIHNHGIVAYPGDSCLLGGSHICQVHLPWHNVVFCALEHAETQWLSSRTLREPSAMEAALHLPLAR